MPPGTTKAAPLTLSLWARPKRDRTLPYKFRFSGRLTPAAGAPCSGRVVVTLKRGRKRVSRKSVSLSPTCRWRALVKVKNHRKFGCKCFGVLMVKVWYKGNVVMFEFGSRKIRCYGRR